MTDKLGRIYQQVKSLGSKVFIDADQIYMDIQKLMNQVHFTKKKAEVGEGLYLDLNFFH